MFSTATNRNVLGFSPGLNEEPFLYDICMFSSFLRSFAPGAQFTLPPEMHGGSSGGNSRCFVFSFILTCLFQNGIIEVRTVQQRELLLIIKIVIW